MPAPQDHPPERPRDSAGETRQGARFDTTSWTLVVRAARESAPLEPAIQDSAPDADAADPRAALATLAERYWMPLYAYSRRRGATPDDARDLTQSFFLRLLEKDLLERASRERGRFRTFLLACFENFTLNEREKERARKRGGAVPHRPLDFGEAESRWNLEPACERTPEHEFERGFAMTVLDRALDGLAGEYRDAGKGEEFEVLRPFLSGEVATGDSAEAATRLGKSPGAFKVAVHRLRRRYGERLRREVADTVDDPRDIDREIEDLLAALSRR